MMLSRGRGAITLLAVGGILLTGCTATTSTNGGSGSNDDEIVIGAVTAETGGMNQYDVPAMAGVRMAIEDLNDDGGVLGRQLRLVAKDYKSERNLGPTVAEEVLSAGASAMIVSCDYDFGSPAALAAQSAGAMSVSLCAGSPRFGPIGGLELGFSAGLVSEATAAAAAEWAFETKEWESAYVLEDTTLRVNIDWAEGFVESWDALSPDGIVGRDSFQNADPSISAQISKIQALDEEPAVIAIASYAPGGASALRQIRAAGITAPVILSDAFDSSAWFDAVPDLSQTWVVNHAQYFGGDPSDKVNELVTRYEEEFGDFPPSSLFVDGYIAMQMIAEAMVRADSTDGEEMTSALEEGTAVETVVGNATFSEKLHTSADRPVTIAYLGNGQPEFEARLTAKRIPSIDTE